MDQAQKTPAEGRSATSSRQTRAASQRYRREQRIDTATTWKGQKGTSKLSAQLLSSFISHLHPTSLILQDRDTRIEADVVLSEVRRKQNDCKRLRHLLYSLAELRRLRSKSVESRHGLYATEEDNSRFENATKQLDELMSRQLLTYDKEEETLRAMMQAKQPTDTQADERR